MTVDRSPVAPADPVPVVGQRLAELHELARAEQAMADGTPTVEQELLLMAAGSQAHRARRHPSLTRRREGLVARWLRRLREVR